MSQNDRNERLGWPYVPAYLPFGLAWIAWCWWTEVRLQIAGAGISPDLAPMMSATALAVNGLCGKLSGTLAEAAFYTLWWRSRGERLPYWRLFAWIAAFSIADLVGYSLRRTTADGPEWAQVLSHVLAGPGTVDAPVESGWSAAFGNFGVLTLSRIGMTAWAQARGLGRDLLGPVVVTTSAWLLTRLTVWWSFDLMRGMSPVR
jgi:hypothetical protein